MYTPRAKRRLFGTPRSAKRFRSSPGTKAVKVLNKRTVRGPSRRGTVKQQLRSLQSVVSKLGPELKYFDSSVNFTNITIAGNVTGLLGIAEGTGETTRIGREILVKDVTIKGSLTLAGLTANSAFRFALVVDRQQISDTAPSATDIFQDGAFSADPISAIPNVLHLERFRILYLSNIYNVNRFISGLATSNPYVEICKTLNIKVSYNGSTSSDIEKNGIYFVTLTNDGSNTADFTGIARVGFTDV